MSEDNTVDVPRDPCSRCMFYPKSWDERSRLEKKVSEAVIHSRFIDCVSREDTVCKVFFDLHADDNPILRIAKMLDMIREV